jgi:hypothetical protein
MNQPTAFFSRHLLTLLLLICTLSVSATTQALDPWSDKEIVGAVLAIGLQDNQKPIIAKAVETCVQGYAADVKKLLRANNQANLKRKILKKRKFRLKDLDSTLIPLLTEEQIAPYETFKSLLTQKMVLPG